MFYKIYSILMIVFSKQQIVKFLFIQSNNTNHYIDYLAS